MSGPGHPDKATSTGRKTPWSSNPGGQPSTPSRSSAIQREAATSGYTNVTGKGTVGPPTRITPVIPAVPAIPSRFAKNAPSTKCLLDPHGGPPRALSVSQPAAGLVRPGAQVSQDIPKVQALTQYGTGQSQTTTTPAFRRHPVDPFTPAGHKGGRKRYLVRSPKDTTIESSMKQVWSSWHRCTKSTLTTRLRLEV